MEICSFEIPTLNWGEPERAPHLMMSTAVCMSVCRSVVLSFCEIDGPSAGQGPEETLAS